MAIGTQLASFRRGYVVYTWYAVVVQATLISILSSEKEAASTAVIIRLLDF